ncbi:desmocollin-2 isoform X2 [Oryzias latipes]|uniref:desmocollin-2 isoform X2 n=1 Tax=Oryzias latipes TaxID=8090 RepID=UPI0005CC7DAD|nr:desmocollin-2 isoform X2 [Oryzias latipes]
MAKLLFFVICLVTTSCVESCHLPGSVYVLVPQNIPVGYQITKVQTSDCDPKTLRLTLKDPSFSIRENGEVVAAAAVSLPDGERTFSVKAQDQNGPESAMEVYLYCKRAQQTDFKGQALLKRTKRRWQPPPTQILENDPGPFPKDVETLASDSASVHDVYYTISGPGADLDPKGVFSLNRDTGLLQVHKSLDREEIEEYKFRISAFKKATDEPADDPMTFVIRVDDKNDNPPEFVGKLQFTVSEQTPGAVVGKVNSTDKDKQDTDHVRIKYSLKSELNLFSIDPDTGEIRTITNTLDREVKDKYTVIIELRDLKGAPKGLSTTGTATITLSDINDNAPTFRKTSYEATIKENESGKCILDIPLDDKDLENTPNWISKLVITKGNENGNFQVERDPKQNIGRLCVVKPLDYEKTKSINLEVSARNEPDLIGTSAQWQSVPIVVSVSDVDEGPEFSAPTIRIPVKENTPNGSVIGSYTALDPETKSSSGIRYYKVQDPASWINVDTNTGELKVANTIDRESHYVYDGLYNITMRAVDPSLKTGTGTVILVIEDVNDNMPVFPSQLVMCENKDQSLSSMLVTAEDRDQAPFSSPFTFSLANENEEDWSIERFNDTTAMLKQLKDLPRGRYEIPLIVRDQQSFGKTQTVTATLCVCTKQGVCQANQSSISLGPLGILALLLPLFLLLLLFLLLAFVCSTRTEKVPFDETGYSGGILLESNTEAPGDEVDTFIPVASLGAGQQQLKESSKIFDSTWKGNKSGSTLGGHSIRENGFYQTGMNSINMQYGSGQFETQNYLGNGMSLERHYATDSSLTQFWRTNEHRINQKLAIMGEEGEEHFADDNVKCYGYEGVGSAAGSVGSCKDFGEEENLDFLNTLGPRFKTLAAVCKKT